LFDLAYLIQVEKVERSSLMRTRPTYRATCQISTQGPGNDCFGQIQVMFLSSVLVRIIIPIKPIASRLLVNERPLKIGSGLLLKNHESLTVVMYAVQGYQPSSPFPWSSGSAFVKQKVCVTPVPRNPKVGNMPASTNLEQLPFKLHGYFISNRGFISQTYKWSLTGKQNRARITVYSQ
jgi:hypothetical protein